MGAAALAYDLTDERPARLAATSILLVSERFCFWDDAREAELRRLFIDEGMSAGAIAKLWDITRNRVVGKLDRLGIKRATPKVDGRRSPDRGTVRQEAYRLPEGLNLPIHELAGNPTMPGSGCRFPTGHSGDEHLFCGLGAAEGRPYCSAHLYGRGGAYKRRKAEA